MPAQGTIITDREFGPVLEDSADGMSGVRHYHVNTHDEYEALFATGVPRKDDSWSQDLPRLTCRRRTTEYIGGTNDSASGVGGWHRVRCEYSDYIDLRPLPNVGQTYTEVLSRTSSVTIVRDVRPGLLFNSPIENGKGTQRDIGGTVARITSFPGQWSADNILRSIEYQARQYVNSNSLLLPPVLRSGLRIALTPRQARYTDYEVTTEAGLLKIVHTLILAPDAGSWFWWTVGPEGTAVSQQESWIYEERTFAGLW